MEWIIGFLVLYLVIGIILLFVVNSESDEITKINKKSMLFIISWPNYIYEMLFD